MARLWSRRLAAAQTIAVVEDEYRVRRRHTPEEALSEVGSFLLRPAGLALRASLDAVLQRPYSNEVVGMMLQWMAQPGRRREAELTAFRDEAQRRAYQVWDARTVVLEDFQKLVHRLEIELPASVLSR